jgi:hypothetical protein
LFPNNPGPGKITLLLSASMVIIFLSLGCLFVFTDVYIDEYPRPYRNYIGYVLGGWALFRGVSVFMKLRANQRNQDDE